MQTFKIVWRLNGLMYVTHLLENKMAAWSDSPPRAGSEIVVIDKEMKEYSTAPLPAQYGPSPRKNNISAAGVRYLGVVFNVHKKY
jgi:hypothetical protein